MNNITIRNKNYIIKDGDFPDIETIPPFNVKKGLSDLERQIYFINRLSRYSTTLFNFGYDNGYFVPINCDKFQTNILCSNDEDYKIASANNIKSNVMYIQQENQTQLNFITYEGSILRIINPDFFIKLEKYYPVIICNKICNFDNYTQFTLNNYNLYNKIDDPNFTGNNIYNQLQPYISLPYNTYVYVHRNILHDFTNEFKINNGNIQDDNLLSLLIMVKNAGDDFRQVLQNNKQFVDRWTFLDTGSTDNTVKIIKEEMKDLPGELYEEPFINFRDSRNRCLELAGEQAFFNIMLDDTYVLNGYLRPFLYLARGDTYFDSFSLFIKDVDITYSSNRITKSHRKLKYVHLLHEVIESNLNGAINNDICIIKDNVSPYMRNRTVTRKQYDLKMLFQELEEDPSEVRTLYYIAETYLVMEEYQKALEYYKKRSQYLDKGYNEEVQDSLYKTAVLSQQFLGVPWETCHQLYLDCYNYDTTRAESLYLIGDHYFNKEHYETAFMYLKQAFSLGVPINKNMNVRLNIYCYHLPLVLAKCCILFNESELGMACIKKMEEYKNDSQTTYMKGIFNLMLTTKNNLQITDGIIIKSLPHNTKKTVAFVIDGGWEPWNGETLLTKGLGGSETFVIKYAETMSKNDFNVLIFCNCSEEKEINGVQYLNITKFAQYIATYYINVCLVNRYTEYVPVAVNNKINTYLIMHDLSRPEDYYFKHPYLKGILCISDWHSEYMKSTYPVVKDIVKTISYGIDTNRFNTHNKSKKTFIYPSFPNRGLLPLLQIFEKIVIKHPDVVLHVFCDTKHKFVLQHNKEEMEEIDRLLEKLKQNVINHGWVNYLILNMYWNKSQYWLYPCKFNETCCLTAYEAAASKTLAITNNLAALQESVGDRGVILPGNPMENKWQDIMVNILDDLLSERLNTDNLIQRNYEWAKSKSYDIVVKNFIDNFITNL